jgi:hypothetical protein
MQAHQHAHRCTHTHDTIYKTMCPCNIHSEQHISDEKTAKDDSRPVRAAVAGEAGVQQESLSSHVGGGGPALQFPQLPFTPAALSPEVLGRSLTLSATLLPAVPALHRGRVRYNFHGTHTVRADPT